MVKISLRFQREADTAFRLDRLAWRQLLAHVTDMYAYRAFIGHIPFATNRREDFPVAEIPPVTP